MTTGTAKPEYAPAPALTCDEVAIAVPCPLCGEGVGVACPHPLNRFRAALKLVKATP